jgi:hypothetical protein
LDQLTVVEMVVMRVERKASRKEYRKDGQQVERWGVKMVDLMADSKVSQLDALLVDMSVVSSVSNWADLMGDSWVDQKVVLMVYSRAVWMVSIKAVHWVVMSVSQVVAQWACCWVAHLDE